MVEGDFEHLGEAVNTCAQLMVITYMLTLSLWFTIAYYGETSDPNGYMAVSALINEYVWERVRVRTHVPVQSCPPT